MNGLAMSNPPPLIRKNSQRNPMIDLEAADEHDDSQAHTGGTLRLGSVMLNTMMVVRRWGRRM